MLENSYVIFGYSGHSYVILDSLIDKGENICGYFDKMESQTNPYNLQYLGDEKVFDDFDEISRRKVFPAVGDGRIRFNLVKLFNSKELTQDVIIDKSAVVSSKSKIGLSTYIGKKSCVNALSVVGKGVIINTAAVVEHECKIGDFSHVAPNSTLCGNVEIGSFVFFGAGAVAKPGIRIGSNSIVGAGSVVLSDIPENEVWAGSPARKLR